MTEPLKVACLVAFSLTLCPVFAHTDSQSDVEMLATGGEVLDLTSREKEQPTMEGTSEPSQVKEELPEEEVKAVDREEKAAEESQEQEEKPGVEETDEDADGPEEDTVSNKSLDLNLASKLMGFKLAEGDAGNVGSGGSTQQDQKHACDICGKSFKFLGTLSRHRKAHGREEPKEEGALPREGQEFSRAAEGPLLIPTTSPPPEPEEKPAHTLAVEPPAEGEASSEASTEKQSEEVEGASDGEGTTEKKSSEKSDDDKKPKTDSPRSVASKADKRKKVCSVCNKRFWSLQDLTRHMRSHTGRGGRPPAEPGLATGRRFGKALVSKPAKGGDFDSVPSLQPTSVCRRSLP